MFPGIVAAVICDKVIVHNPRWDQVKFGIYSFVLGASCYILLQLLFFFTDVFFLIYFNVDRKDIAWHTLKIWSIISNGNTKLLPLEVAQATLLSLPVAYIASAIVNYKLFNKIAQRLSISNKYGDENLFSFFLNADEIDWVYVRDIEQNLTYQGRVVSYSENDNIQEIVLSDVTVFSYKESEEYYSVPSIYLSKNIGRFLIEQISEELIGEENEQETVE